MTLRVLHISITGVHDAVYDAEGLFLLLSWRQSKTLSFTLTALWLAEMVGAKKFLTAPPGFLVD